MAIALSKYVIALTTDDFFIIEKRPIIKQNVGRLQFRLLPLSTKDNHLRGGGRLTFCLILRKFKMTLLKITELIAGI